jgi:GNAT superfamily N-acetyltransferase
VSERKPRTWTVRPGTTDDADALRELFTIVFGVERSREQHAWKFDANPAGRPVLAVAEDDGRLVGQYALWPQRLRLGSEVVEAAQSLDTMTHPDYRGQGMFTALAKEAMGYAQERGFEVLFGFPNSASYPGFVTKLDWDHVVDVPNWTRVLRPSRHSRVPSWAGAVVDSGARLLPKGASAAGTGQVDPDPDLLAGLAAGTIGKGMVGVDRSADYLAWRYDSASERNYRWLTRGRDAVAVWGHDPKTGRAYLAELAGVDAAATSSVLAGAIEAASAAGCTELVANGQRDGLLPLLRRAGFVRRATLPLVTRKLTTRILPSNVHLAASWTVFGADLDTY